MDSKIVQGFDKRLEENPGSQVQRLDYLKLIWFFHMMMMNNDDDDDDNNNNNKSLLRAT